MDCQEARRLLAQGVTPGSASAERAALGFHLARCVECRSYRDQMQDMLLGMLLSDAEPPKPHVQPATPKPAPAPAVTSTPRPRINLLGMIGYTLLGLVLLLAVSVLGPATISAYNIRQYAGAMRLPTAEPTIALPSATPEPVVVVEPSPTSVPTEQPTHTPTATATPTATPSPTPVLFTPTPQPPAAGDAVTILLLGSDRRPQESEPSRTDAVMVARIDPVTKRVALLSLPRDLMVEVPGYGYTRINAANVWGEIYVKPGAGVELARKTVEHLLGIPIDYSIYIDFEGFIGAIDAAGGVIVDVPRELYDPQFPTMDYGYMVAHFLPGVQRMDGATALVYSRIRHPDSDFARMRRQQQVLVGLLESLREQNLLESLERLEGVMFALRDYVRTDIPEDQMLGIAWALRNIRTDQIELYVLDENMVSFGVGNDRWAEQALPGAIETLVEKLMGSSSP